jgi:hypothetical protein
MKPTYKEQLEQEMKQAQLQLQALEQMEQKKNETTEIAKQPIDFEKGAKNE